MWQPPPDLPVFRIPKANYLSIAWYVFALLCMHQTSMILALFEHAKTSNASRNETLSQNFVKQKLFRVDFDADNPWIFDQVGLWFKKILNQVLAICNTKIINRYLATRSCIEINPSLAIQWNLNFQPSAYPPNLMAWCPHKISPFAKRY